VWHARYCWTLIVLILLCCFGETGCYRSKVLTYGRNSNSECEINLNGNYESASLIERGLKLQNTLALLGLSCYFHCVEFLAFSQKNDSGYIFGVGGDNGYQLLKSKEKVLSQNYFSAKQYHQIFVKLIIHVLDIQRGHIQKSETRWQDHLLYFPSWQISNKPQTVYN